jgi:probable phosphoglycerate mutase
MSIVILIRAACTDYDDQHRLMGTLDMPVNARGNEQIREVVRRLQAQPVHPAVILTSPDDPASGTARAIQAAFPTAKLRELDDLRNVNQGLWQGLPEADVRRRFPRLFKSGKEDATAICPPEGETLSDACQRLLGALSKFVRKYASVAIVAPEPLATVIRCALQHRRPSVAACLCGEEGQELVQVFESEHFESAGFTSADERTNMTPVLSVSNGQETPR